MGFGKIFERFDRNPNASTARQKLWASFSTSKKLQLRKTMKDTDEDGVPDFFDCRPHNPYRQEDRPAQMTYYGTPMWTGGARPRVPDKCCEKCRKCGKSTDRVSPRGWCDECESDDIDG